MYSNLSKIWKAVKSCSSVHQNYLPFGDSRRQEECCIKSNHPCWDCPFAYCHLHSSTLFPISNKHFKIYVSSLFQKTPAVGFFLNGDQPWKKRSRRDSLWNSSFPRINFLCFQFITIYLFITIKFSHLMKLLKLCVSKAWQLFSMHINNVWTLLLSKVLDQHCSKQWPGSQKDLGLPWYFQCL